MYIYILRITGWNFSGVCTREGEGVAGLHTLLNYPGNIGLSYEKSFILVTMLFPILEHLGHDMIVPTMWYMRPAKPRISLRICAV